MRLRACHAQPRVLRIVHPGPMERLMRSRACRSRFARVLSLCAPSRCVARCGVWGWRWVSNDCSLWLARSRLAVEAAGGQCQVRRAAIGDRAALIAAGRHVALSPATFCTQQISAITTSVLSRALRGQTYGMPGSAWCVHRTSENPNMV